VSLCTDSAADCSAHHGFRDLRQTGLGEVGDGACHLLHALAHVGRGGAQLRGGGGDLRKGALGVALHQLLAVGGELADLRRGRVDGVQGAGRGRQRGAALSDDGPVGVQLRRQPLDVA
jgi:hypothetical protein